MDKDSTEFYDGHKKYHCLGCTNIIDGNGIARSAHGPAPGAWNDINGWYSSEYYGRQNELNCFGNGKLLADGIYRYAEGPFICSFAAVTNIKQFYYNLFHLLARVVIENYHHRLKQYFPILTNYTYKLENFGLFYNTCLLLTNLLIINQDPLRNLE